MPGWLWQRNPALWSSEGYRVLDTPVCEEAAARQGAELLFTDAPATNAIVANASLDPRQLAGLRRRSSGLKSGGVLHVWEKWQRKSRGQVARLARCPMQASAGRMPMVAIRAKTPEQWQPRDYVARRGLKRVHWLLCAAGRLGGGRVRRQTRANFFSVRRHQARRAKGCSGQVGKPRQEQQGGMLQFHQHLWPRGSSSRSLSSGCRDLPRKSMVEVKLGNVTKSRPGRATA